MCANRPTTATHPSTVPHSHRPTDPPTDAPTLSSSSGPPVPAFCIMLWQEAQLASPAWP